MFPSGVPQLRVPPLPNPSPHLDTRPLPPGDTLSQNAQRSANEGCQYQPNRHLEPDRPTHDPYGGGLCREWDQRCCDQLRNCEHKLDHLLLNLYSAFVI
jgi:hypothetical protein